MIKITEAGPYPAQFLGQQGGGEPGHARAFTFFHNPGMGQTGSTNFQEEERGNQSDRSQVLSQFQLKSAPLCHEIH